MRYALLQDEIGGQIKIIDNSTHIGKKQVENFCATGFRGIGYLESEQTPRRLLRGFNHNLRDELNTLNEKLWDIQEVLKR